MPKTTAQLAAAGALLVAGGFLQVVGDAVYAFDRVHPGDPGFSFANLTAASWHVLLAGGVLALGYVVRQSLSTLGFVGMVMIILGIGVLVAAEMITQITSTIPVPLIAASAPVTGIGAILIGSTLIRSGTPYRLIGGAALAVGLYAVLLIIPTSVGADGANYLVIAGWGLCWAALGAATIERALRPAPAAAASLVAA